MQRLRHVQRDRRADQLQQHERATSAGRAASARGRPPRPACPRRPHAMISPRNRVSSRLTTNAGASLTSTQDFFSGLPTANAVASVASSVSLGADDLQQRHHRDRVEEVEADHPLGVLQLRAISVTDSDEVLVASTQSGRTTASTSANTCCLTAISSNTASITKSASANASLVSEPVTSAGQPVGRVVGADPALARPACRSRRARRPTPLSSRAWSRSVITTGHLQPPGEQQRELRGHQPGADDADLGDRAGQRRVRGAGRPLGALLDQVEGVEPGAQLLAHDQVGERLVLGGEALVAGRGRGPPRSGPAPGRAPGRRRAACRRRQPRPRRPPRPRLVAACRSSGALPGHLAPVSTPAAQRSDCSRKSAARTSRRRCRARAPAGRAASGSGSAGSR